MDESDTVAEGWMAQALQLITRRRGRSNPNPKVGCVIVRDGAVVGQGVSAAAGGPHAELSALLQAGEAARGADLYVTLEPCCHHGRTPPCTDAIIRAGVSRVFVGVRDPNPHVNGGGIAQLQAAGVEVRVGLLGERTAQMHAPFMHYITTGLPWVALKAAVSLDGRIATASGDSRWLTGPKARRHVHRVRARHDAILVGTGTLLADDPRLDVRDAQDRPLTAAQLGGPAPLKVALDANLRVAPTARMLGPGARIYHAPDAPDAPQAALRATGAVLVAVPRAAEGGLDLRAVLLDLAQAGVVRLLVEGGGRLHGALLARQYAQEGIFYVAPCILGRGRPVVDLPSVETRALAPELIAPKIRVFGPDVCIRGRIRYAQAAAQGAPKAP